MSKVLFLRDAKQEKPDNLFLLNYANNLQGIQVPSADSVPTLVPPDKMAILQNGETEPYFKVQAIAYPIEGDGGYYYEKAVYTENFFREFVALTNKDPLPGSKKGHAWMSTGKDASDFYMVGGRVESRGDGTGVVYFKNYIPKMGYETTNEGFLRDLKVNIINFSLVTRGPRYEVVQDPQTKKESINILSPGVGNRNDAVELGLGRMAQMTNALADDELGAQTVTQQALAMIANGAFDAKTPWTINKDKDAPSLSLDGNINTVIAKNGKVYRSALRLVANRAANKGNTQLAKVANALISAMGEKIKEQNNMDKEELLKLLQNMISTGAVGIIDLQNAGLGNLLITEEAKKAIEVVNGFKAIGITDPLTAYNTTAKRVADSEKVTVEAKLTEKYGAEKLENGQVNKLRAYANRVLKDVKLDALENACAELDKDPLMLEFAGQRADVTHVSNAVTVDKSPLINGSGKQTDSNKPRFGGAVKL